MRCYLVRHAQTSWNHENRIQGHSDQPLDAKGLDQAKRVGDYFASHRLSAVYSSHLSRSLQTARAIAQGRVNPVIDRALAEMHLGAWEGLTAEEVNARHQGAYQLWRTSPSKVVIPGAEPVLDFRARVRQAVGRIVAAHRQDESIVIVSHGGVIATLLADWMQAEYDQVLRRMALDNGGISAIDCQALPPAILWVNATHHLGHHTPSTLIPPA